METYVTNLSLKIIVWLARDEQKKFVLQSLQGMHHEVEFVQSFESLQVAFTAGDILITEDTLLTQDKFTKLSKQVSTVPLKAICIFSKHLSWVNKSSQYYLWDVYVWPVELAFFKHRLAIIIALVTRDRHLKAKEDELAHYHELLIEEQTIAENIFLSFVQTDRINIPQVHFFLSPLSTYNGDIFLAYQNKEGIMTAMLGDFTGHGLRAAIGSIPTAEIFYTMSEKGKTLKEIVTQINAKLNQLLPSHLFCAACLLSYDPKRCQLSVWQGGLPTGYLIDNAGKIKEITAKHLPLGILKPQEFEAGISIYRLKQTSSLTLFTDGFTELKNAKQQTLATADIVNNLLHHEHEEKIEGLKSLLRKHMNTATIRDDLAMVNIECQVDNRNSSSR